MKRILRSLHLLGIVPDHMAANRENPWWMDPRENGSGSACAVHFDIDWHPPSLTVESKISLPVLGTFYGKSYRRFFTIADLVGARIEDPMVFQATRQAVFRLV